jgi:hypothetical protein
VYDSGRNGYGVTCRARGYLASGQHSHSYHSSPAPPAPDTALLTCEASRTSTTTMASQGYFFNQKTPMGLVVAQAVGITASTYLLGAALRQAPAHTHHN